MKALIAVLALLLIGSVTATTTPTTSQELPVMSLPTPEEPTPTPCGLGKLPRASLGNEWARPPFVIVFDGDNDGKKEGRRDTFAFLQHQECVARS